VCGSLRTGAVCVGGLIDASDLTYAYANETRARECGQLNLSTDSIGRIRRQSGQQDRSNRFPLLFGFGRCSAIPKGTLRRRREHGNHSFKIPTRFLPVSKDMIMLLRPGRNLVGISKECKLRFPDSHVPVPGGLASFLLPKSWKSEHSRNMDLGTPGTLLPRSSVEL
jgi:hypothetical protein